MTTIKISGMSCGHCVSAVSKALSEVEGVSDVKVNLEKKEASFNEDKPVDRMVINAAITKIGFAVELV